MTERWKGPREWLEAIVRHSGNRGINTNDKRHETRKTNVVNSIKGLER